mmetsp:Transcript_1341/g.3416  ORF Transcript_1341/g.3416 Transcript_1341/m.3416 type:complete len:309 (-) Transcript_1341:755-1681(-)
MSGSNGMRALALACLASVVAVGFVGFVEAFGTTVVYGPSAKELILLTSKLAAKEGHESFCICAPGQEGLSSRLMYGASNGGDDDDDGEETTPRATPISSGDDIQDALTRANSLILVCHETPVEEKAINTLLNSAGSDLSKVVLLSKMGASTAGGGFFGGGDSKLAESEQRLRAVCQSKDLDLSIVRAGQLKGGGPGQPAENDFGLSKQYYNTLFELSEASCTMAHDRFTLGVDCTKGDTVDVPNALKLFGTKTSFDPAPYDTNRINAAMGAVMAAIHDKPVEFSVGTAKATVPPSREEWETMISEMEV